MQETGKSLRAEIIALLEIIREQDPHHELVQYEPMFIDGQSPSDEVAMRWNVYFCQPKYNSGIKVMQGFRDTLKANIKRDTPKLDLVETDN